jgi:hypothetical protein
VDEIIPFFKVSRPNFLPTGWIIQKYPLDSKQVDEIIPFFKVTRPIFSPQRLRFNGSRRLSLAARLATDHSNLFSACVKNAWSYIFAPVHAFKHAKEENDL